MALRLGDAAPNFTAATIEGEIDFHPWLGNSWGVLFSHPADFTPVCTTELGTVAKIKDEFTKRNVKVIAISVDSFDSNCIMVPALSEDDATKLFPKGFRKAKSCLRYTLQSKKQAD